MSEPFIGEIRMLPYNYAPRGWAYCDGATLNVQQYPALFAIIGVHFGGNGQTTFMLPDLRGQVPMSMGQAGQESWNVGDKTGAETASLTETQIPSHTHGAQILAAAGTSGNPQNQLSATSPAFDNLYKRDATTFTPMSPAVVSSTGGSQDHENMQPYLPVGFCIALEGMFPSRN